MVGIARSKGCYACRSRRKKCDEAKPTCGLCQKRGITCAYKPGLNIVLVDPGRKIRERESEAEVIASSEAIESVSQVSQRLSPVDLPSSYLNSYFQIQLRGCLLDEYFPGVNGRSSSSLAWLASANDLSTYDPLVNDALNALAYSNLERRSSLQSTNSTDRSRMLYGKTMRRLRSRICNPEDALSDSILSTVMILAAYEAQTSHPGDMTPWMSHVQASAQLVKLRGSRNSETELARKLFLGTRLTYLIYLIGARKALKEIPPYFDNLHESPFIASYSRLFHILLLLPGIIEQTDTVKRKLANGDDAGIETDVSILSYLCGDMESQLSSWEDQLQILEGGDKGLYWDIPSELYHALPENSEARVFPSMLCFPNIDVAQQLVLKWTAMFFAKSALSEVQTQLDQGNYTSITSLATDAAFEQQVPEFHVLATNITRSLEYLTFPEMGIGVVNFLGLPMNVMYGHWNELQAKERFFFQLIFARLQVMNTGAGKFIEDMAKHGGGGPAFKKLLFDKEPIGAPMVTVR